jgi:catechol 2,3-dioxygenase-like lactoylglutathione lyase family enzyme
VPLEGGIHHITAITADAPGNVDFYARALGLRLVKKTVNSLTPLRNPRARSESPAS